MSSPLRPWSLAIAGIMVGALVAIGTVTTPASASLPGAPVRQSINFVWEPNNTTVTVAPGGAPGQFSTALKNNDTTARNFTITTAGLPVGWSMIIAPATSVSINANASLPFGFFVSVPATATSQTVTIEIIATRADNLATSRGVLTVIVAAPTATPTVTATVVPSASPTPTPGTGCPDIDLPGLTFATARLLLADVPENHGICTQGEEDWFRFGAVGGKVYTIDISAMEAGLDLSLELYSATGERLTSNDDFFLRNPAAPDPRDVKPRIQSWRSPRDGFYVIKVRDTLNLGGRNRTYTLVVRSESYGPTPAPVAEVCRDLFEDDGLPEQARLITSNELQPNRRLCPIGDADWVRFFGKTGKTYYLYTDTRPYKNSPDINSETLAGADTTLALFDRDGITLLDVNDDVAGSLDSQLRFVPRADGFYYAQIKNVGDIGNQFVRYDLILEQCLPDTECGRAPEPAIGAPTGDDAAPVAGPGPDAPAEATPAPDAPAGGDEPTPTAVSFGDIGVTPTLVALALQPVATAQPIVGAFGDAAFERMWRRTDRPVALGQAARGWIWGPTAGISFAEHYVDDTGSVRQVQYFDKGRMELMPSGGAGSSATITNGLLVSELISGRVQIGPREYLDRGSAMVPIAGDPGDPDAPTYASLAAWLAPAADRTGQLPAERLLRDGSVIPYPRGARDETRLVQYVAATGHNIPAVFWDYLQRRGVVERDGVLVNDTLIDWVAVLGYPIAEPYWTTVLVGGVPREVLVQPFERRVLTYVPDEQPAWQVEMGNVGAHYYRWRYGLELPQP